MKDLTLKDIPDDVILSVRQNYCADGCDGYVQGCPIEHCDGFLEECITALKEDFPEELVPIEAEAMAREEVAA
jgi:hypothetical protein